MNRRSFFKSLVPAMLIQSPDENKLYITMPQREILSSGLVINLDFDKVTFIRNKEKIEVDQAALFNFMRGFTKTE